MNLRLLFTYLLLCLPYGVDSRQINSSLERLDDAFDLIPDPIDSEDQVDNHFVESVSINTSTEGRTKENDKSTADDKLSISGMSEGWIERLRGATSNRTLFVSTIQSNVTDDSENLNTDAEPNLGTTRDGTTNESVLKSSTEHRKTSTNASPKSSKSKIILDVASNKKKGGVVDNGKIGKSSRGMGFGLGGKKIIFDAAQGKKMSSSGTGSGMGNTAMNTKVVNPKKNCDKEESDEHEEKGRDNFYDEERNEH
jgi:hypothetical protein